MTEKQRPAFLEIAGEIATISLNRPENYNVIDTEMAVCLRGLAIEVERMTEVKVLVLRSEGKAFCGGGDIRHFVENIDRIDDCIRDLLLAYHDFIARLHQMPQIVLASVQGSAAGAGLSLVAMSDLCIAAEDALFTPAYAKLGVSPDGGGTYGLARVIGTRRALQLFIAEENISAARAAEWGLVSKLVPAASLAEETALYAARLARISGDALANSKRLLRAAEGAPIQDHLADEMESLIRCTRGETFKTAVDRFVKRA
ncbi:MAG: enoyl-CoA hydratase-related protein [Sphingomonadaceae bacterium]|nr:enoyl-CoA hydratase-related protein [Sphingomonadaceae bacterium]